MAPFVYSSPPSSLALSDPDRGRGAAHQPAQGGDAAAISPGPRAEQQTRIGADVAATALAQVQMSHLVQAGAARVPHRGNPEAMGRAAARRIVRRARP